MFEGVDGGCGWLGCLGDWEGGLWDLESSGVWTMHYKKFFSEQELNITEAVRRDVEFEILTVNVKWKVIRGRGSKVAKSQESSGFFEMIHKLVQT